jgi:hypothetical protein
MHAATYELTAGRPEPAGAPDLGSAAVRFLRAPIAARTWTNLLYLSLAFPLGLFYFVFLSVGFSTGIGLVIVWVGFLVLAMTFAGVWGMTALERQLAIHLLGARVPPMGPPAEPGRSAYERLRGFLANPVTWKGTLFLFLFKLPLGIASFTMLVTLLALSGACIATPFFYEWWPPVVFDVNGAGWVVDTLGEALALAFIGLGLLLVSLNLLNALAFVWKVLAEALLGSPRWSERLPAAPPAAG